MLWLWLWLYEYGLMDSYLTNLGMPLRVLRSQVSRITCGLAGPTSGTVRWLASMTRSTAPRDSVWLLCARLRNIVDDMRSHRCSPCVVGMLTSGAVYVVGVVGSVCKFECL